MQPWTEKKPFTYVIFPQLCTKCNKLNVDFKIKGLTATEKGMLALRKKNSHSTKQYHLHHKKKLLRAVPKKKILNKLKLKLIFNEKNGLGICSETKVKLMNYCSCFSVIEAKINLN